MSTPAAPTPTPARVRAYLGVSTAWKNAGALLQSVYDGVWLGVLRRADLHAIDERFYDRNAPYHGDAHNLRGLFPWEETALQAFDGCGRVLVIGAGGGREVLALARRGHAVEGYECNAALVEYAAEFLPRQACDAPVRHLPRDEVPAPGEPFDGIILGWSAYTLIPGRAHRIHLLRRLRALVRPGGPVLLSFFTRAGGGPRFRVSAAVANGIRHRAAPRAGGARRRAGAQLRALLLRRGDRGRTARSRLGAAALHPPRLRRARLRLGHRPVPRPGRAFLIQILKKNHSTRGQRGQRKRRKNR